jgi:hypothetical protein
MKTFKNLLIVTALVLFFYSCTYTSTSPINLDMQQTSAIDSLKATYNFDNIELQGKKRSGSGGESAEVSVVFFNGKGIPTEETQMAAAAKSLATKIKNILKNPKEFDSYTITFDTRVVDGSTTTNNYVKHTFKKSEL